MNGLNARMRGPAPARVSREICSALRRMRHPKRARGVQQYFKHEILALGITTPALRAFVRDRIPELRSDWQVLHTTRPNSNARKVP